MARPEDDFNLKPIEPMGAGEVPKAGLQELVRYKQKRGDAKTSLALWSLLTLLLSAVTASMMPLGIIAWGIFLMLTLLCGGASAFQFWLVATGDKAWQALPDNASEKTALLEDGLSKSVREWNEGRDRWARKMVAFDQDIRAWRRKGEDHGREEGWSEASHEMEGQALLMQGKALMLERRNLAKARKRIRRAIALLKDDLRKSELESQMPDPEPK